MRQLGILCASGEVLTAVAILLVVPEAGAWLERGPPPPPLRLPSIGALTRTRPRALFALGLATEAIALALAFGAPSIDHGVVALDARTLPAMGTYDEIYATFGGTKGQLLVVSADPDESRARARADAVAEVAEQLAANGIIEGFDALGTMAPSGAAQRVRLDLRDALDLPGRSPLLAKMLREQGFAPDAFAPAFEAFAHPSEVTDDVAASEGSAIAWVKRRHLGKDERGTLAVTFVRLTKDPDRQAQARATLRAADPEAVLTGYADLETSLRVAMSRDLPRVLLAAFAMVLVVLAVSLRRASAVALALLVLLVEIAIVLLLTRRKTSIDAALAEQAPLAATTALTTAAGFGALMICRFGGLVDVGKVGALGSASGLLCALVVIPAGLRVWTSRERS